MSAFPSRASIPPLFEKEEPPEFPVTQSPEFADGTRDFNVAPVAAKTRTFRLRFGGLTAAQRATVMAHVEEAKYSREAGSALSFQFTTRDGTVLQGVRYAPGGVQVDHVKTWSNSFDIVLIDSP